MNSTTEKENCCNLTLNSKFRSDFLFWATICLISVSALIPWWSVSYLHVDHAETFYHAFAWLNGRIPYRDDFTHHFIGYVIPVYLIGFIFPIGPVLLKSLCILFKLLTAWANYKTASTLFSPSAGKLAALLTVTLGIFFGWQGNFLNNQGFQEAVLAFLVFNIVKFLIFSNKRNLYYAGSLLGILITFDQRCLVFSGLFALILLIRKDTRNLKTIINLSLATLVVPILLLIALYLSGSLSEFYEQTIVFPLFKRNSGIDSSSWEWYWYYTLNLVHHEPIAAILATLGVATMLRRECRSEISVLFISAFVFGAIYIFSGKRFYSNYPLILSPFIICIVAGMPYYAEKISGRSLAICYGVFVVFAGLVSWLIPLSDYAGGNTIYFSADESVAKKTSEYILDNSDAEATLLVWGYKPQVYLRTNKLSWYKDMALLSIGGANFNLTDFSQQGLSNEALFEFKSYLKNDPPDIIVHYKKKEVECYARYCFGRGEVQKNMDFTQIEGLKFLASKVESNYELMHSVESPTESTDIYFLH